MTTDDGACLYYKAPGAFSSGELKGELNGKNLLYASFFSCRVRHRLTAYPFTGVDHTSYGKICDIRF